MSTVQGSWRRTGGAARTHLGSGRTSGRTTGIREVAKTERGRAGVVAWIVWKEEGVILVCVLQRRAEAKRARREKEVAAGDVRKTKTPAIAVDCKNRTLSPSPSTVCYVGRQEIEGEGARSVDGMIVAIND